MDIIEAPKRNVIFDATLFNSLISCARFTDLRHNRDLVPIRGHSISLEMGSMVHKILEVFNDHVIKRFPRNIAVVAGMNAGEEYAKDIELMPNTPPEDRQLVLDTMTQYFEFWKNDSWIPLASETVRGRVLYEDDEIRIVWKAKLDVLCDTNEGIFPVDHKTMRQRRESASLNNQFIGQCLVCETRKMWVNKIGFQTSLKPNEKFMRVPIIYSAGRLLEWQSEILPYWAKIMIMYEEGNYWPPNFTHCDSKFGFCVFKPICEANPEMREEELRIAFVKGDKWDPANE